MRERKPQQLILLPTGSFSMEVPKIPPISFVLDHHRTLYFGNNNNPPTTPLRGNSCCWNWPKLGREDDIDLIMRHDATIHCHFIPAKSAHIHLQWPEHIRRPGQASRRNSGGYTTI